MTAKEICQYANKRFGVTFTTKGMTHLLHRLDFSYMKPKHVPGKANPEAQEEFLERYNELKKTKGSKDRIWFVYGVHPLHNSQPAYGWLKKRYNYTLKSNTGLSRININGAYNIEDHKVVIEESELIKPFHQSTYNPERCGISTEVHIAFSYSNGIVVNGK